MGFGQGLGLRPRAGAKGLGFGLRPRLGLWARAWAKAKAGAKGAKAKAGTQKNTNLCQKTLQVGSRSCGHGTPTQRDKPLAFVSSFSCVHRHHQFRSWNEVHMS